MRISSRHGVLPVVTATLTFLGWVPCKNHALVVVLLRSRAVDAAVAPRCKANQATLLLEVGAHERKNSSKDGIPAGCGSRAVVLPLTVVVSKPASSTPASSLSLTRYWPAEMLLCQLSLGMPNSSRRIGLPISRA